MDSLFIPIIRGRSYHPQTQGSVESSNGTFKDRLASTILEIGKKDWIDALPSIAETINTTRPSGLPSHITPYEVWFGRKPIWLGFSARIPTIASSSTATGISAAPVEADDDSDVLPDDDEVDPDYMLSELHRRVFLHNAKEAGKLARKGGETLTYEVGQIVLLAIPPKNRLSIEATRLPCRILTVVKGAYTLLSQHGPLKGRHQGSTLRAIQTQEDFGIPMAPLAKAKLITLPSAVTLANNRKSISAQQKMGNMATVAKKRKRTVVEEAEELAAQEAEAIIVQRELDEQFARDVEESVARRGLYAPPMSSPTPAPRPKRATRAPARFDGTVSKAGEKKDKGKGRQM
jgi:hypothetical protein